MQKKAAGYNRTLDYGRGVHVIVRDTEMRAREYAAGDSLKLDDEAGRRRSFDRALDSHLTGVARQCNRI